MNNFTKGVLVGVGIGLLVAPLSGEETRRLLAERVQEWRDSLPEDSRLNRYAEQVSDRVNSTRENWRGYAQQAISRARDTSSALSNRAMQSGQEIASKARQTGQDVASRAKQSGQEMASKTRQTGQNTANKPRQGAGVAGPGPSTSSETRIIPETNE
jgi:gas vesicle protein